MFWQVFDDITVGRTLCDHSGRLTLAGFKLVAYLTACNLTASFCPEGYSRTGLTLYDDMYTVLTA